MSNKKGFIWGACLFVCGMACLALGAVIAIKTDFVAAIMIGTFTGLAVGAIVAHELTKGKTYAARPVKKADRKPIDPSRVDAVVEYIKENYSVNGYALKALRDTQPELTDSKFGGYPYWDKAIKYPETTGDEKLVMLAQINFDKAQLKDDRLPQKGMLQFFIADEDVYGADFDDGTKQDKFRVVYHENVDYSVTVQDIIDMGIPANVAMDNSTSCLPSYEEYAIRFEPQVSQPSKNDVHYDDIFARAVHRLFGQEAKGFFSKEEEDYLYDQEETWGHKILGYPNFTQYDPRFTQPGSKPDRKYPLVQDYDTLLLQIDSTEDFMWGDSGVANFFISAEKLKKLDFSDVLYNWDCY